jgi:hypothetical protein
VREGGRPSYFSCEQVVIGTHVNNGYSEMPYDCAAPCVSWNAAGAFDLHSWTPSTATQQDVPPIRPLHKTNTRTSFSSSSSSSSSSSCMAASYMCGSVPCLPGLDSLGIGFDAVFGRKRVVAATKFTYLLNKTWAHPGQCAPPQDPLSISFLVKHSLFTLLILFTFSLLAPCSDWECVCLPRSSLFV